MKRQRVFALLLLFHLILGCACHASSREMPISTQEIESHIRYLSDDLLEGRGIGTRGLAIAALYQENFFRSLGLEPLFNGSYRQLLHLAGSTPDRNGRLEFLAGPEACTLKLSEDFVMTSAQQECPGTVEADVVYCGFLISAPERAWDDIKGCDLKGKVLMVEVNEPGNYPGGLFDGRDMTYYGRWTYKIEHAAQLGARGILIIHNPERAGYNWDVVQNSWSKESFFSPEVKQVLSFQGWISESAAGKMLRMAHKDHKALLGSAEKPEFTPVNLGLKARVCQKSSFRKVDTENVAGLLRGKGKARRDRYVVLSAHYDHLGKEEKKEGDTIYNGAVDNCSASAAMLALARYYAERPEDLDVNLIFLAATAEEGGFFGSDHFVRHLPVPKSSVIADINFEMTNVWGETEDLYAIGARHSDLDEVCREGAGRLGCAYTPEKGGELGFFYRSDQISFARGGIPSVWLHQGIVSKGSDPDFGIRKLDEYQRTGYHKVSDQIENDWDLRGTVQIARWAREIITILSARREMPQFKSTSSFSREREYGK
jgi:Zn-dependent M28 family amino/carboxypeptidase